MESSRALIPSKDLTRFSFCNPGIISRSLTEVVIFLTHYPTFIASMLQSGLKVDPGNLCIKLLYNKSISVTGVLCVDQISMRFTTQEPRRIIPYTQSY